MGNGDLLGIGAFAVLSGLSINALRHYDEIGLLRPAQVDSGTGYRRYHPAQVRQARVIWALRHVELPVESVREAVTGPEGGPGFQAVLRRHRDALAARADALWNADISSFVFGTWPGDEFFLLTVAHGADGSEHGEHHGPAGTSRFGLLVADVDAAHQRALAAGATERHAPYDAPWKPRTSHVTDPSGNWVDLFQG